MINRINIICKNCRSSFGVKPYRKNSALFCSSRCCGQWKSINNRGEQNANWRGGLVIISCLVCNIDFQTLPSIISNGNGKFCSRKCYSEWDSVHKNGANNPRWKGGITPKNKKIRNSPEYKKWRISVFQRDSFMCILGGKSHGYKIQADHIKPFSLFIELRFDINNGRTLCVDCHKKTDSFKNAHMKKEDYA